MASNSSGLSLSLFTIDFIFVNYSLVSDIW